MKDSKLTRNSIIEHLKGEAVGLSDGEAKELLTGFFKTLEEEVKEGVNVKLYKFGTFKSKKVAPKKAKNFKTGEEIITQEKTTLSFVPSIIQDD
jgi:nucleoid DNA-binding protein